MFKRIILPQPVLRNLLILALAAGVVIVTQVNLFFTSARTGEEQNVYLKILNNTYSPTDTGEINAMNTLTHVGTAGDVERIIEVYNARVNKIFNDKIALIVRENDLNKMLAMVTPPSGQAQPGKPPRRAPCRENNASTYCVAQKAVKEYADMRQAMIQIRNTLSTRAMEDFDVMQSPSSPGNQSGGSGQSSQQSGAGRTGRPVPLGTTSSENQSGLARAGLTAAGIVGGIMTFPLRIVGGLASGLGDLISPKTTRNDIDRELAIARQALDQALSVYNELQMALPTHKKYKEVYKKLEQYRDKVARIRREVEYYPNTFLNVTTTACS